MLGFEKNLAPSRPGATYSGLRRPCIIIKFRKQNRDRMMIFICINECVIFLEHITVRQVLALIQRNHSSLSYLIRGDTLPIKSVKHSDATRTSRIVQLSWTFYTKRSYYWFSKKKERDDVIFLFKQWTRWSHGEFMNYFIGRELL